MLREGPSIETEYRGEGNRHGFTPEAYATWENEIERLKEKLNTEYAKQK
ncbi:MAG: hypothetical protein NUV57_00395 [archaeon]|nr:hypothetical protein [archaeon]